MKFSINQWLRLKLILLHRLTFDKSTSSFCYHEVIFMVEYAVVNRTVNSDGTFHLLALCCATS